LGRRLLFVLPYVVQTISFKRNMRPEVHESTRHHSIEFVIVRQLLQSGYRFGSPSPLAAFAHRKTVLEPRAAAFFKLHNLVCGRSEGLLSALYAGMCMAQHLLLSA